VVALLERLDQLVDVGRPHRPEHHLVGLGVPLEPHGDVLGDQPLQGASQLVLVALGLGVDRHGEQRLGQHPRLDQGRAVLAGQGVGRLRRVDLRHQRQVARDGVGLGQQLVAHRRGERTHPLVVGVVVGVALELAADELSQVPGHVDRVVGTERPGEDPHQREPPDVRVGGGADDLGDEGSGGVAGHLAEGRADRRVHRGDRRPLG
jgi:hypothetical protein